MAMDSNVVKRPDYIYKVRGSLVTWVLHKKAHDAFIVWVLIQDFIRSSVQGKPSGRIRKKHFVKHLIRNMKCNANTAERRLRKAIRLGFIVEDGVYYIVTGRNRMIEVAIRSQLIDFKEDKSTYNPSFFFMDDREYAIKASDLIDPESLGQTKILLYGILAVHGSRQLLSRDTHAKILGNNRDAVLKISKKAKLNEVGTFLLINPMNLLFKPKCNKFEAINALKEAEALYRFGTERRERVRGRELLHRKRVREEIFLSIQLPNTFTSTSIQKEVPVKFETFAVLLGPGEGGSRIFTPDRAKKPCLMGRSLGCDGVADLYEGHKELSLEGRDRFMNSQELAGYSSLSESFIDRYLTTLRQVLDEPECRNAILHTTGADDIRPLAASSAFVWRGKAFVENNTLQEITGKRSRFLSIS